MLEICTVHRISGYQGYHLDIRGIINEYQGKMDRISVYYLTDLSRILGSICWMFLNINQISVGRGQRKKNNKKTKKNLKKSLKTAMFRPNTTVGYQGYQPNVKAFCTPDIMSCHPLQRTNSESLSHPYFFPQPN